MHKEKYRRFTKFTKLTGINLTGILLAWGLVTIALPVSAQLGNLNFIFGISGNVWIKRVGSPKYERVSTGRINVADRLKLEKGAKATVVCGNFRRWKIPESGEFVVDSGCYPGKRKIKIRPGAKRCCTRSNPNNPKVPYIISPRNTNILPNQPINLRWNPIKGASSYDVSISGPGVNWETKVSQSEVSQPQVVYSGRESFKPGSRYWVTVVANNGVSSRTGFTILSQEDSKKIQAEISQLQQIGSNTNLSQKSSNYFQAFAQAEIYHSNGLNHVAIDVLEKLIEQGGKTRAVYQRLGNIYQEVGLNRLAKQRYLTALELAAKEQAEKQQNFAEKQEKALIEYRLGEVNQVIGDLKDSYKWYQAARDSFRALENQELVQELQEKLDYLKPRV